MNRTQNLSYQSAVRSYVDVASWNSPHAVTLTLRQSRQIESGFHIRIDHEAASSNYRHFMNLLNKEMFGKAHTRFGKRIRTFSTFEGSDEKRLHIHAVIDCPRTDLNAQFPEIVRDAWLKTDWGYDQIDVQPNADGGWINYISKLRDKPDYADAIDWSNSHID